MGMVDLTFVNFIKKKKLTNAVRFQEPMTGINLHWSCVEQVVVRMGKDG